MSKILESGEMYLENIYVLKKTICDVRAIDIVNKTGYSKPSISRALGLLKNDGFITVDKKRYISLTPSGEEVALKIYERHTMLSSFFQALGVSAETAAADACKIEHVISDETFEKMKEHAARFGNKL